MTKKTFLTVLILLVLFLMCFASCKTVEPGVIKKTDKYRIVEGNAKNFQLRYEAKKKRDSINIFTNKNKKHETGNK